MTQLPPITFATRFRGFLPVVIDVETGGFNSQTDALLEIAAVLIEMRSDGTLTRGETHRYHVAPFPGANMEPASLAVTGIDPHHPLRPAIPEEDALQRIFREVRNAMRAADCTRAVLVGHNAFFDLNFLNAAVARTQIKRNPFHPFSSFDTATLGGVAFGQTVLMRATLAAGLEWDTGLGAFRRLRRRANRGSLLHGVQSISGRIRASRRRLAAMGPLEVEPEARGTAQLLPEPPARRSSDGLQRLGGDRAGFGQQLFQFAALVHLDGDVAAADEFAVDIKLRESGPVGIGLQRLAHFRVLENIHMRELRLAGAQGAHGLSRKAALREIGRAFHVQHHRGGGELAFDPFNSIHSRQSPK